LTFKGIFTEMNKYFAIYNVEIYL